MNHRLRLALAIAVCSIILVDAAFSRGIGAPLLQDHLSPAITSQRIWFPTADDTYWATGSDEFPGEIIKVAKAAAFLKQ